MIITQFNSNITTLRSDYGGEYTSHEFTTYLLDHDITHPFSCPYTSEQNDIAERKNRHILETARTLLHHASLPLQFWLEAASTVVYLINRLPTKTLQMHSPYQNLYDKSASFLHLKIFGCLCYPCTAYTRHHKLDLKSSPSIFLGYSTDHEASVVSTPPPLNSSSPDTCASTNMKSPWLPNPPTHIHPKFPQFITPYHHNFSPLSIAHP